MTISHRISSSKWQWITIPIPVVWKLLANWPCFLRNSLSDCFNEVAVVRSDLERRVCWFSFFKDATGTLKYVGVYWPKVVVFFGWSFDDEDQQQKWEMILMIKLVLMMMAMMTMQRWHTCWWRWWYYRLYWGSRRWWLSWDFQHHPSYSG